LATVHQRYRQTDRQTDRRISYGIGLTYRSAKNVLLTDVCLSIDHYTLYVLYYFVMFYVF